MSADLLAVGTVGDMQGAVVVRLGGRRALVQSTLNPGETARRAELGLGAVVDATLLTALAELPAYEALPWSVLERRVQRVLRHAPVGVARRDRGEVTRLLTAPIRVDQVTVWARDGRVGLKAASAFAPYARRAVVLPSSAVTEVVRLDAALYGVGVYVRAGGRLSEVVRPAPFVVNRWTWASWLFAERVYGQLLKVRS